MLREWWPLTLICWANSSSPCKLCLLFDILSLVALMSILVKSQQSALMSKVFFEVICTKIFIGVTYNSCTTAGGFSKPWCSTATTTTGQHINGYWGDCGAGCPTETTTVTTTPAPTCSTPCKFPFVYMGKVHYACTNAGGFQPAWCSTATDQYGNIYFAF